MTTCETAPVTSSAAAEALHSSRRWDPAGPRAEYRFFSDQLGRQIIPAATPSERYAQLSALACELWARDPFAIMRPIAAEAAPRLARTADFHDYVTDLVLAANDCRAVERWLPALSSFRPSLRDMLRGRAAEVAARYMRRGHISCSGRGDGGYSVMAMDSSSDLLVDAVCDLLGVLGLLPRWAVRGNRPQRRRRAKHAWRALAILPLTQLLGDRARWERWADRGAVSEDPKSALEIAEHLRAATYLLAPSREDGARQCEKAKTWDEVCEMSLASRHKAWLRRKDWRDSRCMRRRAMRRDLKWSDEQILDFEAEIEAAESAKARHLG